MEFNLNREPISGKNFLSEFKETLYYEILKSQRASSIIVLMIALLLAFVWSFAEFFNVEINAALNLNFPAKLLTYILYGLAIYEFLYILLLNHYIKRRRHLFPLIKYLDSVIEISFVSLALITVGTHIPTSILVFCSPGFALYFLFIIISALKLDVRLSIFTGVFAMLSYFFCFYYLKQFNFPAKIVTSYDSYLLGISRGVPLLITGLLVGLTAKELKKRIIASLENISARNAVISMFGQYVSPVVVDKLIHQTTEMLPESRNVCILFFDIRDFTSFADDHTPEETVTMLNRVFDISIRIINNHNGFINKFLGDGFMAVFGAPLPDENNIQHATAAAFAILKEIDIMNINHELPQIKVGIALHAGPALTGSVGSEERKEYTVVGDTVNVASRIEQLNKKFNSQLIVSDTVYQFISKMHPALSLHTVEIRGKKDPMKIYILA